MSSPASQAQRTVLLVLFDDVQSLDVTGPLEVFTGAERHTPGSYRLRTASLDGAPVRTSAGLTVVPDESLTRTCDRIAGDEQAVTVQLATEYDPQPPYDAGSVRKAPARVVDALRSRSRFALTPSSRSGAVCPPGRR